MKKWTRMKYMPCAPLGKDGKLASCCSEHIAFTRRAAAEGMVLLKNKGILPLAEGTKLAVFGKGQIDHIVGVADNFPTPHVCNFLEGLQTEGFALCEELLQFYSETCKRKSTETDHRFWLVNHMIEPEIPQPLLEHAAKFTDTAVIILGRSQGENTDRKVQDFYLSAAEQAMIRDVCAVFSNVVVLLNIGAAIETGWIEDNDKISAALLTWYPGMEGGKALADILLGRVNPSGKMVDTFARKYDDYPSSATFGKADTQEKYYEDIYVGYRYFETVPEAAKTVVYPFGYGLS